MDTKISSHTGVLFQIHGATPTKKLWINTKQEAVKYIDSMIDTTKSYDFYFVCEMPCGEILQFKTSKEIMDLPIKDIPCPCGDSTHWLVRFVSFD